MSPSDSRHEVASAIVHAALKAAGVRLAGLRPAGPVVPESFTLDQVFPLDDDDDGGARFRSELAQAARRLELNAAVPPIGPATFDTLVASIAALLPARLFRCQDSEGHLYKEKGTGKCRIDGTELEEVVL